MELSNWRSSWKLLAVLYALTAAWAVVLPTRSNVLFKYDPKHGYEFDDGRRSNAWTAKRRDTDASVRSKYGGTRLKELKKIFKDVINTPGTAWICAYVACYKMGERGAINNIPLFLLDKGVSKHALTFWNGSVCSAFSILGSLFGGMMLAKTKADVQAILASHSW